MLVQFGTLCPYSFLRGCWLGRTAGGGALDGGAGSLQNGGEGGEGAGFRVFVGNLAWVTQSPVGARSFVSNPV
jgi:hypothetical protein